jgi:ribosome-interacting GTPase 1
VEEQVSLDSLHVRTIAQGISPGFDVQKSGDARVVMIGALPSTYLTNAEYTQGSHLSENLRVRSEILYFRGLKPCSFIEDHKYSKRNCGV